MQSYPGKWHLFLAGELAACDLCGEFIPSQCVGGLPRRRLHAIGSPPRFTFVSLSLLVQLLRPFRAVKPIYLECQVFKFLLTLFPPSAKWGHIIVEWKY